MKTLILFTSILFGNHLQAQKNNKENLNLVDSSKIKTSRLQLKETGNDGSLYINCESIPDQNILGYASPSDTSEALILIGIRGIANKKFKFGQHSKLTPTDPMQIRIDDVEGRYYITDLYIGGELKSTIYFKSEDIATK